MEREREIKMQTEILCGWFRGCVYVYVCVCARVFVCVCVCERERERERERKGVCVFVRDIR